MVTSLAFCSQYMHRLQYLIFVHEPEQAADATE
jgi:hypothetical protein